MLKESRYVRLAKTMYRVLRNSRIPIFLHRKSNHVFTVWQHIVLLTIRQYESKSYRLFAEWLVEAHYVMDGDFKNVSIEDLKLFGRYEVFINSIGNLALPSETSQYDYIGASLPNGFNMTIKLLDKASHAEIVTKQKPSLDSIKVDNESKIEFHKIRSGTTLLTSVPVLEPIPIMSSCK